MEWTNLSKMRPFNASLPTFQKKDLSPNLTTIGTTDVAGIQGKHNLLFTLSFEGFERDLLKTADFPTMVGPPNNNDNQ